MTRILAIDPGSEHSAWLGWDSAAATVGKFGIEPNEDVLTQLRRDAAWRLHGDREDVRVDVIVIEWMTPRGMPTSAQEFETLYWIGRFAQAAHPIPVVRLPRLAVKRHLCGNPAANDQNIRAALIDRFGGIGGKAAAVGTVKAPGPLHGVANDVWSALALAVTYADQEGQP